MSYRIDDLKSVFNKSAGAAKGNRYRVYFQDSNLRQDITPSQETTNPLTENNTVLNNITNSFLSLVGIDRFRNVDGRELDLLCDSVNWPGRQMLTSDRQVSMKLTKHVYGFAVEELAISFILTNDWRAWNFLEDWQDASIGNLQRNHGHSVNYKDEYVRDIVIEHLAEDNTVKKSVRIKNAFPTSLNSLELGNGNENTILRCSASFSYDNWEIIG